MTETPSFPRPPRAFSVKPARAGLEVPIVRTPFPAVDDVAGWTT